MPRQYDILLEELRRAETAMRGVDEMRKARPASALFGRFNTAMQRAAAKLDAAAKSLPAGKPSARPSASPAAVASQRVAFAKSLAAINLKVSEAAASGSVSALDICRLQSRLNALAELAAPHLRAVGL